MMPAGGAGWPADDGEIAPFYVVGGEQLGQPLMRLVGLGDHQQSRGIAVDAVDDAGPLHPANAGEFAPAMVEQRVNQRAIGMTRGGMHHQPSGLIDDDQIVVLEDDVE